MFVLGLNIGHNSTACLLKDGKIITCVSEERFSRIKNHAGIPFAGIDYILKSNGLEIKDLATIVLDDHYPIINDPKFVKQFLESYIRKPLHKRILSKIGYNYPNFYYNYNLMKNPRSSNKKRRNEVRNYLARKLNYPIEKIILIDHHYAHALAPCFNLNKNQKTLVFTLDGEGSGTCATVNIFDGKNLKRIAMTDKSASLGYLYAITTIILGMKPLEHEFKVMGLAPYAKTEKVKEVYEELRKIIWVDSLKFKSKFNMPFVDNYLLDKMKFVRFDTLAGAVQMLTEELTLEWIRNAIKATGIHNIALAGGVFMNVKANQRIANLDEVQSIFVMPSCGDESNAIGSCFFGYRELNKDKNINFRAIEDLYLGPECDNKDLEDYLKKNKLKNYTVKKVKKINKEVAKLLAEGQIVARCSGRSEWGARSLGNRAILANPSDPETIRILNETIKDRDFWMPFTPSIIEDDAHKYIKNPKKIKAPYMTLTFDSTKLAQEHLSAAMHPYDFTLRPQIVYKNWNKGYYDLIKEFKKLTKIGGILNTSFNLHGEPNVLTINDAIHTLDNSALRYLAIGDYLIKKN
ncbi:hypothetical protein FJZ21_00040 [Candidatus Pacearchaeota archaeon]|nr:hypothetical protein [Candidatus Pacearchaeota archaeon]